jgi:hypothetical protein
MLVLQGLLEKRQQSSSILGFQDFFHAMNFTRVLKDPNQVTQVLEVSRRKGERGEGERIGRGERERGEGEGRG